MSEPITFDGYENLFRAFSIDEIEDLKRIEKNTPYLFGYVYFLEYGNLLKIGYTKNPYTRIMTLKKQGEGYSDKAIGRVALTPMCTNYVKVEKTIHELFKDVRRDKTELFDISFYDAVMGTMNANLDYLDESKEIERRSDATFNFVKSFISGEV